MDRYEIETIVDLIAHIIFGILGAWIVYLILKSAFKKKTNMEENNDNKKEIEK